MVTEHPSWYKSRDQQRNPNRSQIKKKKKKVLVIIVIKKTIIFIAATYIRTVLPVYFFNKALKLDTFKIFLFSLSAGGAGKG